MGSARQSSNLCDVVLFFLPDTDKKLRGPGIEPGSTAWKATMLTITPATLCTCDHLSQQKKRCILRGSNPRGLCPLGLKSSALTTRPRMHDMPYRLREEAQQERATKREEGKKTKQKKKSSQSETRTHNLPVNSRARCRLRHPGNRWKNCGRRVLLQRCRWANKKTRKKKTKGIPPAGIEPATNRLKVERST